MDDPVIIEVRVNEYARRTRNPHVPFSPEEIAADARACWEAGASIVHYHARDPESGAPSFDAALYAETVRRIRAETDLLTMPTLGAWWVEAPEDRIAHVLAMAEDPATRPHFAPIDMATTNVDAYDPGRKAFRTDETVYRNTTKTWRYFAEAMRDAGVRPVPVFWNVSSIRATEAFVDMGLFQEPLYCELVVTGPAAPSAHPATVGGVDAYLGCMPDGREWAWSVMCGGGSILDLVGAVLQRGGHVSIGLGDHPYEELHRPTNAELVARVAQLAADAGRPVATPAQTRALLGMAEDRR